MSQGNRKNPTLNQEQVYFAEVEGLCPLCGKNLIISGKTKYVKKYEIAHIYPCNPTVRDLSALSNIEPPIDIEDFSNKIALCRDCHKIYDDDKTKERYMELKMIKERLLSKNSIRSIIGIYPLEEDINDILTKLLLVKDNDLETFDLNIKALKIKEKIEDKYTLLRRSIEGNVTKYYSFVQKSLKEMGADMFDNMAIQIKSFCKKCESLSRDKEVVFDQIVEWVMRKSKNDNKIASEIVVSFFVQNCEVFDAIAK